MGNENSRNPQSGDRIVWQLYCEQMIIGLSPVCGYSYNNRGTMVWQSISGRLCSAPVKREFATVSQFICSWQKHTHVRLTAEITYCPTGTNITGVCGRISNLDKIVIVVGTLHADRYAVLRVRGSQLAHGVVYQSKNNIEKGCVKNHEHVAWHVFRMC
jgi:hypothetical protein